MVTVQKLVTGTAEWGRGGGGRGGVMTFTLFNLKIFNESKKLCSTVEPRFNDLRFNDIPGITINIRLPRKSYSKMYGAEPRFNDLRFNDIPSLTMGILFPERKIFPV